MTRKHGIKTNNRPSKPRWARAQYWEVWYEDPRENRARRVDRRRRTKKTAERVASELRQTGNYMKVWVAEVNTL